MSAFSFDISHVARLHVKVIINWDFVWWWELQQGLCGVSSFGVPVRKCLFFAFLQVFKEDLILIK